MNHFGAEEQAIIEEELDSAARLVLRSVEVERNQLCRQKRLASPGCMQRFLGHGARRVALNRCSRNLGGFFIYADRPVSKLGCSTVVVQLLPNKPIAPIAARTRASMSDVIY